LTSDNLDAENLQPYGYCAADGGAMSGSSVSTCVACVSASDDERYLANFMTALSAGCEQQPAAGMVVGLNDTVFSPTKIQATNPSASAAASSTKPGLPTTSIVGIVVGIILVLLVISGFFFVRHRKNRNRRLRLGGSPGPSGPRRGSHRPASSLSFRCQAHLSPRSPAFQPNATAPTIQEEKPYSYPRNHAYPETPDSQWSSTAGFRSERALRGGNANLPLHNIATSGPAVPSGVHYSTSPKAKGFSPVDDLVTPASTTSTKSTSQLLPLRSYNPAEYGASSPQMGNTATADPTYYTSPVSGSTTSPLISRMWDQKAPTWDAAPMPRRVSSRQGINVKVNGLGGGKGRKVSKTGSPVESKEINTSFPGPPPAKR
jgi:hypothetical protein